MRTRDARARAERALADLAVALGPRARDVTVIGGLNADLLTSADDAPHQGTVDVDIAVEIGFIYDRDEADFGWLERGLVSAGFSARTDGTGWRWWREVDGFPVKVELLCDVYDHQGQEIALPGCAMASAQNLRGPGAALNDRVERPLAVTGAGVPSLRFTGLGGYVLAKAAAAWDRRLDKDFYDLAFVLIHNVAGGPAAAGRAAAAAEPRASLVEYDRMLVAVLHELADPSSDGARAYAEQRVRDGVDLPGELLAQDAAAAAEACREAFVQGRGASS